QAVKSPGDLQLQQQVADHDTTAFAVYSDGSIESGDHSYEESTNEHTQTSNMRSNNRSVNEVSNDCSIDALLNSQLLSLEGLDNHHQKLAEEASYAKYLAAAAAVERWNLAE
ncbi:hypothetical protein H5410_032589, partial [Solanum commersonii]